MKGAISALPPMSEQWINSLREAKGKEEQNSLIMGFVQSGSRVYLTGGWRQLRESHNNYLDGRYDTLYDQHVLGPCGKREAARK